MTICQVWWPDGGTRCFRCKKEVLTEARNRPRPGRFTTVYLGWPPGWARPRRGWDTPNEHQRGLWGILPADPVYRIGQRFQRSHYGGHEQDDTGLESLREDWTEINEFVDLVDL